MFLCLFLYSKHCPNIRSSWASKPFGILNKVLFCSVLYDLIFKDREIIAKCIYSEVSNSWIMARVIITFLD